jgi:DNA-binding NarL/FixJ family response regulator
MYSILIIEDDPANISMMETILQMEGFDVQSASDAQSGLALIREKRPDLILCDIMMPEMDGYSVLETLKSEKTFADIPFIFVTALAERADVRQGMSEGADDYLPKPFSVDELLAAITGRIRRHELLRQQRDKSLFQQEESILRSRRITRQERVVLKMVGQGNTSRDIAERLGIAVKTVEVHRTNLMNKLGAGNAASLARWALIAEQMDCDAE